DGKRLASASADTMIRLWDLDRGQEPLVLKGHTGEVVAVTFSPDGKRLASKSIDGSVRLWDVNTGQEPLVFKGYAWTWRQSVVRGPQQLRGFTRGALAFSPDGKRLASQSADLHPGPYR